ncbi:hypothetical protein, partial [Burkholderia stabilis]
AAGVASARRYPHPKAVLLRMRGRCDATVAGHVPPPRARLPAHRSGAARRARRYGPLRAVPLRRHAVQTVGDDTYRSISIGRAHDAAGSRAGGRLK